MHSSAPRQNEIQVRSDSYGNQLAGVSLSDTHQICISHQTTLIGSVRANGKTWFTVYEAVQQSTLVRWHEQRVIQRDPDKLKQWAHVKLTKFNEAKCKVLHMGQGNAKCKHWLRGEGIESSPAKKHLGLLVDEKLNMTQQRALTAQKVSSSLGCIKSSVASRSREVILPLCSTPVRPRLESCIQLWSPPHRKDTDLLEQVQRRTTTMIQGREHLSYEEQAERVGLFRLGKSSLQGELTAAFQYLNGPPRKLERDFLQGHVVIGQGVMASS